MVEEREKESGLSGVSGVRRRVVEVRNNTTGVGTVCISILGSWCDQPINSFETRFKSGSAESLDVELMFRVFLRVQS